MLFFYMSSINSFFPSQIAGCSTVRRNGFVRYSSSFLLYHNNVSVSFFSFFSFLYVPSQSSWSLFCLFKLDFDSFVIKAFIFVYTHSLSRVCVCALFICLLRASSLFFVICLIYKPMIIDHCRHFETWCVNNHK